MTDETTTGPGDLGPFDWDAAAPGDDRGGADHGGDIPGAVRAVQIPGKYDADTWRRVVTVYHLFFQREGRVPTFHEAHASWPRIPERTYEKISLEPEFQYALSLRGIEYDPTDTLSDLQSMALMKLTDPADRRTERAKLRDLGISWPRYQGWLKNAVFVREKKRRTEELFADVSDVALMKLRGNVEAGDQRAIEFALEVTGRYNRQQIAIQDARIVVQTIVEAVIKNVTDPEVRDAILADARAAVAGFDLNNRKALGNG